MPASTRRNPEVSLALLPTLWVPVTHCSLQGAWQVRAWPCLSQPRAGLHSLLLWAQAPTAWPLQQTPAWTLPQPRGPSHLLTSDPSLLPASRPCPEPWEPEAHIPLVATQAGERQAERKRYPNRCAPFPWCPHAPVHLPGPDRARAGALGPQGLLGWLSVLP